MLLRLVAYIADECENGFSQCKCKFSRRAILQFNLHFKKLVLKTEILSIISNDFQFNPWKAFLVLSNVILSTLLVWIWLDSHGKLSRDSGLGEEAGCSHLITRGDFTVISGSYRKCWPTHWIKWLVCYKKTSTGANNKNQPPLSPIFTIQEIIILWYGMTTGRAN